MADFDAQAAAEKLVELDGKSKPDLTMTDRGFIAVLNALDSMGFGSTAMKLYTDTVGNGRRGTITADDFPGNELDQLRQVVEAARGRTGQASGVALSDDYKTVAMNNGGIAPDYDAIGGFQYNIGPDDGVAIRDVYDFNRDRDNNSVIGGTALQAIMWPRQFAAALGRRVLPDDGGGVPVEINLPPR